jgi:hypothetical protein
VGDAFHVDAARGHIGGHQDAVIAILETLQRLVALVLAAIAMDGGALKAAL